MQNFVYDSDGEEGLHAIYRPGNQNRNVELYINGYDRTTTHYFPITDASFK